MIDLLSYGFLPELLPQNAAGLPARVMAVHRERYTLICEHGETQGVLKAGVYYGRGGEDFPTTGDFVLISYQAHGESLILSTLKRKSKFSRSDFCGHAVGYAKTIREQVVAANFDEVFIMQSLNHDLNRKRMERYLAMAWQSGAQPVVILTKADLTQDLPEQLRMVQEIAIGAPVFAVSAKTGQGLDALTEYLKPGRTVVFLGSSGVGKSTLVNALAGESVMAVQEIREDDSRGRHTTTHRQLILLKSGVMTIDTPGMRELGMWDLTEGLGGAFADVEQYLGSCRFADCKHQSEPGCAVKAALASGELSEERWENYCGLTAEASYVDDRAAYQRKKQQWHKDIAMLNRHRETVAKRNGGKR
mgnify:CR=1 FL=1